MINSLIDNLIKIMTRIFFLNYSEVSYKLPIHMHLYDFISLSVAMFCSFVNISCRNSPILIYLVELLQLVLLVKRRCSLPQVSGLIEVFCLFRGLHHVSCAPASRFTRFTRDPLLSIS